MSGIVGGALGYWILRAIGRPDDSNYVGAYNQKSKIDTLLGSDFWNTVEDKLVIDFGCGFGDEAIEIAKRGARKVIGIDNREDVLTVARSKAEIAGQTARCTFVSAVCEKVDVVISIDAFEHFDDPSGILAVIRRLLKPNGRVFIAFGPTWYHPLGGHLFSVFPFAHLLFTEKALIRWRSDFKTDSATKFSEVAGGLNQMTISKFESILDSSDFKIVDLQCVPIKKLRFLANRLTREFTTSFVRCELTPKGRA